MFFAKIGEFEPCGVFSVGHLILFTLTVISIIVALILSRQKSKEEVKKILKRIIVAIWMLELFRIGYKLYWGDLLFLESYMPLFYCSIFLYSGLLGAFGKGIFERAGNVVLATGSIVGGLTFLVYPATSLPDYPAMHFVSVYSFLYHGCMVYVGLLMLINRYIELKKNDIFLYAISVVVLCLVALVINCIFDCNLMFISKGFPGSLGKAVFEATGVFYTPLAVFFHVVVPYYFVYGIYKLYKKASA